ncbi:MAG: polyribonucleotide nucleotidyltransferase [Clostridiales bacterium]|jgi:polyribonucleotide nucleotidyltransferase|nr:polyribonucleotide nucleotidyltransferase [Clostridiales bacterium]MDY2683467.1 polyribonucleotide nucleotidyltransferase [Eubacteriales bacterium]MEE0399897.1 polyribonucleotide nucleotidyltransferase [Christensenellales bacterium]MCI6215057.1 polyribonucleotide nucleotidyltransferase [Clostridiales bacterium]MCI6954585.1 polyribonucleotide nucleotidyltransferase [Clostridiales bacterium]
MERKIFKTEIGGREVSVEIGAYCGQANGSCLIRCGETVVLTNATMAKTPRDGIDFFPLGVDFEEKMFAVGKIPGGFKKREGRPSDKAILTSRLIDRPIRPLFPKGCLNDVAVVATALSVDKEIPPEVFGMLGSSIALSISDIPFAGPTASVVVGYVDGKYIINPTPAEREKSKLHLSLAGTKDAIMMVEAGANIISEKEMLDAILFGHEEIKKIITWIEGIQEACGKAKQEVHLYLPSDEVKAAVFEWADKKMDYVLDTFDRTEREARDDALNKEAIEHFADIFPDDLSSVGDALYALKKVKVRAKILDKGIRPDGRSLTEIRPIWCEHGILPRVHGSAVFTRGQTQALTTCTLGTISEVQKLEGLDDDNYKRYMHHYNMPPYSTGEAKPAKSPGRREIGHGALAERALEPVLPDELEFPYAIRTVSDILSSNGSTSMASVCGSTMALEDAGVPIKAPVAGIAMGLIKDDETGRVAIMSDIQGLEDFLGDMDFKVAGTKDGITAIQMDIKIKGINEEILRTALEQARQGRLFILNKMAECIAEPKKELSKYAPKIIRFNIDPDKIKDVIGSGGKVINKIIDETGVKIDISDDGMVFIACEDIDRAERAKAIVLAIAKDPEVGDVFEGPVVRILQFGAFVNIAPGKDGMIHISKLADKRVEKVEDVVNIGDRVKAEVIKVMKEGDKTKIDLKLLEILDK